MHFGTNCSQLGILSQIQVRSESSDKWDHHCCFEHLRKGEWFHQDWIKRASVQSLSHTQLCDPMDCSMPGFPFHHQLLELVQTHVHQVDDAIQPSYPLYSKKSFSQSVQSLSCIRLFVTPWIAARLSITNSQGLLKLMSIESVMPSSHFILCRPFLLLPPIPPSIRVFSSESTLRMRWPKYWSFSFSISPSNEHPGLISFRMDWLDLLAVQETLKSLLQHRNSKASILWCSAFSLVQLSHPYMTTGKTIALARRTFVGKVMSLVFNMLSRLVITFLPMSKCLLISWLQSPSAVILEPQK